MKVFVWNQQSWKYCSMFSDRLTCCNNLTKRRTCLWKYCWFFYENNFFISLVLCRKSKWKNIRHMIKASLEWIQSWLWFSVTTMASTSTMASTATMSATSTAESMLGTSLLAAFLSVLLVVRVMRLVSLLVLVSLVVFIEMSLFCAALLLVATFFVSWLGVRSFLMFAIAFWVMSVFISVFLIELKNYLSSFNVRC